MGKRCLVSAIICLLLVSCAGQEALPTSSPSALAEPTSAATPTPTVIQPSEPPPTPTFTPLPPYPNKKVIFHYYTVGDHSLLDLFFGLGFRAYTRLVLYEDGLMILVDHPYKQKVLSPDQVERFFSRLRELGFYSLESNQKHDPTDKLYNYGSHYQKSYDGRGNCVYVNFGQERTLCAYEPDLQFLVPQMKTILSYLDEYRPSGMTPYYPDRILLLVEQGRDPNDERLPSASIPWRDDLPALDTLPWDNVSTGWGYQRQQTQTLYVDGPAANAIYLLLDGSCCGGKVVTQKGQEYTVYMDIVLPHEQVTNAYQ